MRFDNDTISSTGARTLVSSSAFDPLALMMPSIHPQKLLADPVVDPEYGFVRKALLARMERAAPRYRI
jgi:hypothetical protein